jgi:hypothetical protein
MAHRDRVLLICEPATRPYLRLCPLPIHALDGGKTPARIAAIGGLRPTKKGMSEANAKANL